MKKTEENRYPHSAALFRFCKEALEMRFNGNVKVIDQDVGGILGYDPADCSHWKKGKKNIKALSTLRVIANHLNVDERLLVDITSGKIDLCEAMIEFKGYGQFTLETTQLELLKKEYFKNPARWQGATSRNFDELFEVDHSRVVEVVKAVLQMGSFKEAPIYLPELYQLFPNLKIESESDTLMTPERTQNPLKVLKDQEGKNLKVTVSYPAGEMRPYLRFMAAREIYRYLCESGHPICEGIAKAPEEVQTIIANVFALNLLVPGTLLKQEIEKLSGAFDLVQQLSDLFWVSKALMNQRIKEFAEHPIW